MVGNVKDKEADGTYLCVYVSRVQINMNWPSPISEHNCTILSIIKVSTSFLFNLKGLLTYTTNLQAAAFVANIIPSSCQL